MNILLDINHPAHVHLLRNVYALFIEHGHKVIVAAKEIPSAMQLLGLYGIPYVNIGKKDDSIGKKGIDQLAYDYRLFRIVQENHIDIGVGTSINLPHVSKLSRMKSIVLDDDDDEVEPLFVKFGHPFADAILTPSAINRKSAKTVYVDAYHELAYLHPKRFTPDPSVLCDAKIREGERNIDDEFKSYQLTVSPEKIHSLIYYATMLIGDSQTMTSEAAVLGTPAVKCNSFAGRLTVPNELEQKYGLCYSFLPEQHEAFFAKIDELLFMPDLKGEWQARRQRMLGDKIDYAEFLAWFVENYPQSKKVAMQQHDFQIRFR